MFDVGFTELMLIGIVALVVIGPERLPDVARTVGKWIGKMQRFVRGVKSDIAKELDSDELKKLIGDQREQINELRQMVGSTAKDLESTTRDAVRGARKSMNELEKAAAGTDPEAVADASLHDGATPDASRSHDPEALNTGSNTADSNAAESSKKSAPAGGSAAAAALKIGGGGAAAKAGSGAPDEERPDGDIPNDGSDDAGAINPGADGTVDAAVKAAADVEVDSPTASAAVDTAQGSVSGADAEPRSGSGR